MNETFRMPRSIDEGRRAVSIRRGVGEDRMVAWHYFKTRKSEGDYNIHVKDGNSLTVQVYSGLPRLRVVSGHVTVMFQSRWGNSLTIEPGASAHVIVPFADTKVTISGDDSHLTMDLPDGKHRVYWPSKYESSVAPVVTAQARLRRRIAALERRQAQRIELVAEKKLAMDLLVAKRQLEIDNLKATVTIAVSPKGAAATGVVA